MSKSYKPLGDVCGAVRWLASECVLNKTAVGEDVLLDDLLAAMPYDELNEQADEQIALFREVYENERMQVVMTGVDAPGVTSPKNLGFWPSYEWEREAGNISEVANGPWDD